jgi:outer membrane murein-binding lipoprotein Lpp
MSNQSLADLIRQVRLRADGMANHLAALSGVGLSQADVDAGRALATQMETLDAEQEALKAALKAKTAEIVATQKEARGWRSRVTRRIKAALEDAPELWVEFGITAKK